MMPLMQNNLARPGLPENGVPQNIFAQRMGMGAPGPSGAAPGFRLNNGAPVLQSSLPMGPPANLQPGMPARPIMQQPVMTRPVMPPPQVPQNVFAQRMM